jgi:hypothetical protein
MKKRSNRPIHLLPFGRRACTVYQRGTGFLKRAYAAGGNKWRAEPGDLVRWEDSGGMVHIGRMMGMLDAPAEGPSVPAVKDHVMVFRLSETMRTGYECWVDKDDIVEVLPPPKKFLAWLMSDEFNEMRVDDILYLARYGTLSEDFIKSRHQRLKERDEQEKGR